MFPFGSPFLPSTIAFLVIFYLFIEKNVCYISHKCYQIFPVARELNYLRNIMYNLISLTLSIIFIDFIKIIISPYPAKG